VFRVRARTDGGYGSYGGEIELETSHEGKGTNNTYLITINNEVFDLLFSSFKNVPCAFQLKIGVAENSYMPVFKKESTPHH